MKAVTLPEIVDLVCEVHQMPRHELVSHRRMGRHVDARFQVMYAAVRIFRFSMQETGRALRRDHSTVVHGLRQHETSMAGRDARAKLYRERWERIWAELKDRIRYRSPEEKRAAIFRRWMLIHRPANLHVVLATYEALHPVEHARPPAT